MGMFHNLMAKIFSHGPATATPPLASSTPPLGGSTTPTPANPSQPPVGSSPSGSPTTPSVPSSPAAAAPVDLTAILDGLAAKNTEDLEWKRSIVDMLKLVGMDSSLSARKELADDLQYPGDQSDSAAMNEWLHQEVLKKLAANGGKVPADLLG